MSYNIVVCGSIVPDPLQTLEPIMNQGGPGLKNEMMLPSVLDPWAAHALYEAANFAKKNAGSKVYLISLGPKAKLQQLMMNQAQKVPFELVAIDGNASGFTDSSEVASTLAEAIKKIPNLDMNKLLLFGGQSSASRDSGSTLQMVGELLGIKEQFVGVDELRQESDGHFIIYERVEGGNYQISKTPTLPMVCAWATGKLSIPPNNPQIGMQNMKAIMPALSKAQNVKLSGGGIDYLGVEQPKQKRETKIVKNVSAHDIAKEIVAWIKG